jgi:two-component system response regulator FixJ
VTSGVEVRRAVTVDDVALAERCRKGRVVLIDDEPPVREAFGALLEQEGYAVESYASATDYLSVLSFNRPCFPGPSCVLSDVKMPEQDGLDLMRRLASIDSPPLILMSGSSGPAEVVDAFRGGAFDFLLKPIHPDALLGAVRRALDANLAHQQSRLKRGALEQRLAALTPRERDVIVRVAKGVLNRVIAEELGVGIRTVKLHRQHAMEKLGVTNLVDLAHFAQEIGL